MKNKWETKSLEWIHKVRQEIDSEIQKQGLTLAEWVKKKESVDIATMCKRMGLKRFKIRISTTSKRAHPA